MNSSQGHTLIANRFKNFKCNMHSRFFEVNIYEKDPVNKHHWRADVDRPAGNAQRAGGTGRSEGRSEAG